MGKLYFLCQEHSNIDKCVIYDTHGGVLRHISSAKAFEMWSKGAFSNTVDLAVKYKYSEGYLFRCNDYPDYVECDVDLIWWRRKFGLSVWYDGVFHEKFVEPIDPNCSFVYLSGGRLKCFSTVERMQFLIVPMDSTEMTRKQVKKAFVLG